MKTIPTALLEDLARRAARATRARANHNLHPTLDDPIQRFFNALQPGTYVRPHRHTDPPRWEVFLALRGRAAVVAFDDSGRVSDRCEISPSGHDIVAEIDGGIWHTVAALSPDTVLFELKPGPYSPIRDKDFADWAPAEGEPCCDRFVEWFATAAPGDEPPGGAGKSKVEG